MLGPLTPVNSTALPQSVCPAHHMTCLDLSVCVYKLEGTCLLLTFGILNFNTVPYSCLPTSYLSCCEAQHSVTVIE